MSELVDHLAELTGFRDRDLLDVTLVGTLRDLLQPRAVAMYRCVGEVGEERWLTRARLRAGESVASADPAWADIDGLPRVTDHPERLDCLVSAAAVVVPGDPHVSIFPVTSDREVVGVLEVQTAAPLDAQQQRVVCSILRIVQNFQSLLDYSERDTLTGLLNRKTFDESFLKATAQVAAAPAAAAALLDARRASPSTARHWLGVIDIDHFKRVNDGFGHLIGDEVLLLLARLMRSSFRHHDRLYRFGGEEFVVLMRCADEAGALAAFERLRANTERYAFPQVGRITVSVGVTEVRPVDTPTAAFERADKAVYHAKQHGRNRVESHAALVAAGALAESAKVGDVELF